MARLDADGQDVHAQQMLVVDCYRHLVHDADADILGLVLGVDDFGALGGIEGGRNRP